MGVAVLVTLPVALLLWTARTSPGQPPAPPAPSSALAGTATTSPAPAPAATREAAGTVLAGGRVESSGRRELAFAMPGVVAAVHVKRGSSVKAGELLLELDSEAERAEVAQTQAALDIAKARLDELREGARPEELEQARRDAEAAAAVAADAREKATQAQNLVKAGATTRAQALEAQRSAEAADARAQAAQARLSLLERGSRRTSITSAEAEVARARAALALSSARLGRTRLVAPADGTVVEVRARAGEATGGMDMPAPLVLTDLAHLEVKVDVPEAKATLVRAGDAATITVEALPARSFTGRVTDVGLEADRQKGTLEVTVAFDDAPGLEQVRPRMAARVAIDVKTHR